MKYLIIVVSALFSYFYFQGCMYEWQADKNEEEDDEDLLGKILPNNKKKIIALAISFAAAFLLTHIFLVYGYLPTKTLKYLLLIGGLIPIAWEDWQEKRIPNRWLIYLLGIRVAVFGLEVFSCPGTVVDNLIFTVTGGVVSGLIMFTGYVMSRHQIGGGDVKLFTVIGMYLGARLNYFVMIASLIFAAVYGGGKVVLKHFGIKDEIAFAPFIVSSVILLLALGF